MCCVAAAASAAEATERRENVRDKENYKLTKVHLQLCSIAYVVVSAKLLLWLPTMKFLPHNCIYICCCCCNYWRGAQLCSDAFGLFVQDAHLCANMSSACTAIVYGAGDKLAALLYKPRH